MEHSEYRHFLSQAREEIDVVVVPTGGHDGMGCMLNQLKLTPTLNEELDQAMKDIRQFGNQGAESSRRITELESLCKQHEEAIEKLKQENATLKLGIQSLNELILEIATETRLDGMGEDDNENNSTRMMMMGEMLPRYLLLHHLLPLHHLLMLLLSWLSRRKKTRRC
jgi:hypothetical protein